MIDFLKDLHVSAKECNIGIIPTQFEKLNKNHRLGLKSEDIEKLFFAFYEINIFNYKEFIFSVIGNISNDRKDFLQYCFNILSNNKDNINVSDLIKSFNAEQSPSITDEKDVEEIKTLNSEFSQAINVIIEIIYSKLNENSELNFDNKKRITGELNINEDTFIKTFHIFSIFQEDDDEFYNFFSSCFELEYRKEHQKLQEEELENIKMLKSNKHLEDSNIFLNSCSEYCPVIDKAHFKNLSQMKKKLLKLDKKFFIKLNGQLAIIDSNSTKLLNFDNFSKAVKLTNVSFIKNEISYLYNIFENKNKGLVNYEYILRTLIDNNHRINSVCRIFKKLENRGNTKGKLCSKLIFNQINTNNHPDVINGNIDADEVYEDFTEAFYDNFANEDRNHGT